MRQHPDGRLYSASNLVNFLGYGHATVLDVRQLTEPVAYGSPRQSSSASKTE